MRVYVMLGDASSVDDPLRMRASCYRSVRRSNNVVLQGPHRYRHGPGKYHPRAQAVSRMARLAIYSFGASAATTVQVSKHYIA